MTICLMSYEQYLSFYSTMFLLAANSFFIFSFFVIIKCICEERKDKRDQIIKDREFELHWKRIDSITSDLKRK